MQSFEHEGTTWFCDFLIKKHGNLGQVRLSYCTKKDGIGYWRDQAFKLGLPIHAWEEEVASDPHEVKALWENADAIDDDVWSGRDDNV